MDIETLARQVASEAVRAVPDPGTAAPMARGRVITDALLNGVGPGADLMSAFRHDGSFGDLRGGWLQQPDGSGAQIQEHTFPHHIVDAIITGKPAGPLIDEARAFAESRTSASAFYAPIAGATVMEPVGLDHDIELVPWSNVPAVLQKTFFDSYGPYRELLPLSIFHVTATTAILIRSPSCRVLFSSKEEANRLVKAVVAPVDLRVTLVRNIIRCITVEGGTSVVELGGWTQFDVQIANNLIGTSYSFSNALFNHAVYAATRDPARLDTASIPSLFLYYEEFADLGKNSLNISLDRFSQALLRPDIIDKAIDLGIALEILLLHEMDSKGRGEMKFRSSIRGAMFLGGEKQDRLKTFKLLKDAYDLRSAAVHAGALPTNQNQRPPTDVLEEAGKTYARIARKLIERGSFPNWDDDYVIGE